MCRIFLDIVSGRDIFRGEQKVKVLKSLTLSIFSVFLFGNCRVIVTAASGKVPLGTILVRRVSGIEN